MLQIVQTQKLGVIIMEEKMEIDMNTHKQLAEICRILFGYWKWYKFSVKIIHF